MVALDEHRVLISSAQKKISVVNTKSQKIEPVPSVILKNAPKGFTSIRALKDKSLIYRAPSGLWKLPYPYGSKPLKQLRYKGQSLIKVADRVIAEDNNGRLWIGSKNGVIRVTINSVGEVVKYEALNDNPICKHNKITNIRAVYIDPLYKLAWIGTGADGLVRVNLYGNKSLDKAEVSKFMHKSNRDGSISSNFVTSILRLPNNELWIGTEGGGICKVINSRNNPKFVPFTERDGLSNNVVKTLIHDKELNLWVATNIGLNKFDTQKKTFRIFGEEHGLPFVAHHYFCEKLYNGNLVFLWD